MPRQVEGALRPRIAGTVAALLAVSLVAAPLAAGQGVPDDRSGAALGRAGDAALPRPAGISADPGTAAWQLLDIVQRGQADDALLALAELLRRSGIPLVSPDGPVVAVPDEYILAEAAIYEPLLGDLLRAIRRGDSYGADDFAVLLQDAGMFSAALPTETLVGGLGVWGKDPDAPAISRVAGAATRAAAALRHQVLYPGATGIRIDALQMTLILAHAMSRAYEPAEPAAMIDGAAERSALDRLLGVGVARAADDPCAGVQKALKAPSEQGQIAEAIYDKASDELIDSWKEFALKEGTRKTLDTFSKVYSKGTAIVNTLLLLMGARLDMGDDKGGQTHYLHPRDGKEKHVTVTALASFSSGLAQNRLACYALAGIEVPPNGPLAGFRIRWSVDQAQGRVQAAGHRGTGGRHLATATSADSDKLLHGEVTSSSGASRLELKPPREKEGIQNNKPELTGDVTVYASLDKDDFPFKLGDLFALSNPAAFAAAKSWQLFISAVQRVGLPSQRRVIRVTYHGTSIYTIKGKSVIFLFWYMGHVGLDIHTCTGLNGPWVGEGGYDVDQKVFAPILEKFTGQKLPDSYFKYVPLNFTTNLGEGGHGRFDIIPPDVTGVLEVDAGGRRFQKDFTEIGTAEIFIADQGLAPITIFNPLGARYPIVQLPEHPECPTSAESIYDN